VVIVLVSSKSDEEGFGLGVSVTKGLLFLSAYSALTLYTFFPWFNSLSCLSV
jgi:hypothetical protein